MLANNWQPIETAPKDATYILGYELAKYFNGRDSNGNIIYNTEDVMRVIYWDKNYVNYYGDKGHFTWCVVDTWQDEQGGYTEMNPTYWMPLPEPPVVKEEVNAS